MFPEALLESLCRTGNFRQLVDDACRSAVNEGRGEDATLYRAVGDQVCNAWGRRTAIDNARC